MLRRLMTATVILAALLPAAASHAQILGAPTAPVQKPVSIKLGAFFPTNSSARSDVGNTWFQAGLDYAFRKTDNAAPLLPLVYLDYAGKSRSGIHESSTGLGVGVRAYGNRATNTKVAPYFGAGLGAYFLHASGGGTTNKTVLGGKVNAGVELNQGPFLEAAYQITGKVNGDDLNGVSVLIGDRF